MSTSASSSIIISVTTARPAVKSSPLQKPGLGSLEETRFNSCQRCVRLHVELQIQLEVVLERNPNFDLWQRNQIDIKVQVQGWPICISTVSISLVYQLFDFAVDDPLLSSPLRFLSRSRSRV